MTCPRCLLYGQFDECSRCAEEGVAITYEQAVRAQSGFLGSTGDTGPPLPAAKRVPVTLGEWISRRA